MGCSDCGAKGGCDTRKHGQRALLDEAVARLYPDRTWGQLDDEARFGAGLDRGAVRRLARAIAQVTRAPVIVRPGEGDDLCDFAWVLCVGKRPSLLELREGLAGAAPEDLVPGVRAEERWLRVAFSSVARLAAMQEVALSLEVPEGAPDPSPLVRESPRPGVFDPVLLPRVQKIVALLEAADVAHIDFGLLDRPLDRALPGDYEARHGVPPRLANFLFQAAPPSAPTLSALCPA